MKFPQPNFDIARHVGRHLEEIAFVVTAKPYLEWNFPDSSSVDLSSNRSSEDARGILIALREGDVNPLKYYMDREYDFGSFKKPAYSLLTKAIRQGNYALVYLVIKSGLRSEYYNPEIAVDALLASHMDIVYLLLRNGVKSLGLADVVRYGDENIIKFLTSPGYAYSGSCGYTLFDFAEANEFELLEKLLEMRMKPDPLDIPAEETKTAYPFTRLVRYKRHHKALIMILQYDTPIPMLTVLTCLNSSLDAQPGLETLLNMPSPESPDGKLADAMFQFCFRFSYLYWFQYSSKAHKIRSEGRHKEFLINIAVEEGLQKAAQYLLIRRHDIKKYNLTLPHDANTA